MFRVGRFLFLINVLVWVEFVYSFSGKFCIKLNRRIRRAILFKRVVQYRKEEVDSVTHFRKWKPYCLCTLFSSIYGCLNCTIMHGHAMKLLFFFLNGGQKGNFELDYGALKSSAIRTHPQIHFCAHENEILFQKSLQFCLRSNKSINN